MWFYIITENLIICFYKMQQWTWIYVFYLGKCFREIVVNEKKNLKVAVSTLLRLFRQVDKVNSWA